MAGHDRFSLKGKVILVTGATRRYGLYMCEGLCEAGGTVCVTSRDKARAEDTALHLASFGGSAYGYAYDQGSDDSIEALVGDVMRDHGRIDVLVNNARCIPETAAPDIGREELNRTFSVNAVGMILLTRTVVNEMRQAGGGVIINVGSIYGMGGQDLSIYEDPDMRMSLDYPMQKGGVLAYTKQLATCLARHGIRANCLSLGGLTETAPKDDDVFLEAYRSRTPMRRLTEPDDVKGPIVFLASDASAYMTGANLVLDGGWTAW
jgi:NAD(P)-dependent dehydrogenase (short-subunit alcohol dehydrogenase family)